MPPASARKSMTDNNLRHYVELRPVERRVWVTPVVIVASADGETNLVANTISDATANLQS
jgi:hypothetical protein